LTDNLNIGEAIRIARLSVGISQQELADALGYKSRSTIAKIEAGEVGLNYNKLSAVARVLGTTVEHLTGEETAGVSAPVSMSEASTIAVILAGGSSSRNSEASPNQFIDVNGKPVIMYCLEAYEKHPSIDAVYIVCLSGWEQVLGTYINRYNITKFAGLISAGATGIESVKNAIDFISQRYDTKKTTVVLQESTRPMISTALISKALVCCEQKGSAVAYRSMDEFVQFTQNKNGELNYINRESLYSIESPEAHPLSTLVSVFEEASRQSITLDDTCFAMFMHKLGHELCCFESSSNNIKIVRQEDIAYFKALLETRF
jgi:2-C-methyl-D-erythritol 4-phosphate cytidylyltransferase